MAPPSPSHSSLQLDSCSVCLEHVGDGCDRSVAKLKCGHHFHLDCIGSAFNAKGSMQCPNCRQVEDGQWRYGNGAGGGSGSGSQDPFTDFENYFDEMVDWGESESHSVPWCPYHTPFTWNLMTETDFFLNMLSSSDEHQQQHVCPYVRHPRTTEEQLVVVQNPPSGGSVGASVRGPPTYVFHEVTGWSPHIPATPAVGTMNDDDPSTLPTDRFRWSAPANRSEATQPVYYGQDRSFVNSSWQQVPGPCPQYGYVAPSRGSNSGRRWSRHEAVERTPSTLPFVERGQHSAGGPQYSGSIGSLVDRPQVSAALPSFMDRLQFGGEASRPSNPHLPTRGRASHGQGSNGWYRPPPAQQHGQDSNGWFRAQPQQQQQPLYWDLDLEPVWEQYQQQLHHHQHRSSFNEPWFSSRSTEPESPQQQPLQPQYFFYTGPDGLAQGHRGHTNDRHPR